MMAGIVAALKERGLEIVVETDHHVSQPEPQDQGDSVKFQMEWHERIAIREIA